MTDSPKAPPAPARPETALVPVKPRHDGWTPEKQRAFIEHLADTGCVKDAAGLVGMTETSAYRLRRRADAAAFDAAWEAALEKGVERLASVAVERALKGTVKRIWYHGELVAEETVYSERLLLWLLSNGRAALGRAKGRAKVIADWDRAIDSLGATRISGEPADGFRVWRDTNGTRLTNFPPPPQFAGYEEKKPGVPGYCRTLTVAEKDAEDRREAASTAAAEVARRKRFSGSAS